MSKIHSFRTAVVLAAALAAPAAALAQDASSEYVKALIERAAAQVEGTAAEGSPLALGQDVGPRIDLSADEAVARALERNLDLQVQRLNPQLTDYNIAGILASYRPTLTSFFSGGSTTNLPGNLLQGGGDRITNDQVRWDSGVRQNVMWGGGSFVLNFNNSRTETSDLFATRNPSYFSNLSASYTQPLLRNFRTDANRTSLLITRIAQEIEDIDLRSTVTNTEAAVRNAYWDLVFAVENVDAARRSLELATKLVDDNRARVEIGTMAPIDVVQAQAEEASRRQALVTAENTQRTAELTLKRLIVSGTDDDLWRASINPLDRPSPVAEPIDLEAAVANALRNRTDLDVSRKTLEQNSIALRNLRNQTLPDLNLVANYSAQGRGGTVYDRLPISQGGGIRGVIPGGYVDALSNIRTLLAPSWSFQLNFSYPIGTSAADANLARTRVQLQQINAQIKQAELQVATDVTTAAVNVRNSLQAVEAAIASRELSDRRLEAAQSKFDVGMATNFEVVQAQRDLADARASELRSLLDYRKALVDFERSQLTGTARTVTAIR